MSENSEPKPKPPSIENEHNSRNGNVSAKAIIRLVRQMGIKLFHTPEREPFVSFWVKDHWENCPVRSLAFQQWLSAMCYHRANSVPSNQALTEAANALAGDAVYASPEKRVFVRIAEHNEAIYIDLSNDSWEAIRITGEGWDIVAHTPIQFVRAPGMQPLPHPIDGGRIDDLRPFLNVGDEDQWKAAVAWLVGALRPVGPCPILIVEGNHGSAKTTLARLLRSLVDPNIAALRTPPTNPRDLAISAGNSWCLGFDNLSSVKPWLSDALCRLSTGSGFATRSLYTDDKEKIFQAMRPVLLNGIDMGIERPDLLDRSICLSLVPIPEEGRETEKAFWARFESIRPYILGSLLDAVACALRRVKEIKLERLPRMADFATWVCAAEPELGWPEGSFLEAYRRNRADANSLALEASALTRPLIRIAEPGGWQGTATQLRSRLSDDFLNCAVEEQWSCPDSPRELSQAIRRLAPILLQVGITVEFSRTAGNNSERIIRIMKTGIDTPAAVEDLTKNDATQAT